MKDKDGKTQPANVIPSVDEFGTIRLTKNDKDKSFTLYTPMGDVIEGYNEPVGNAEGAEPGTASPKVTLEAPVTDATGNPVVVPGTDASGNPLAVPGTDASGTPLAVPGVDASGNPVATPGTDVLPGEMDASPSATDTGIPRTETDAGAETAVAPTANPAESPGATEVPLTDAALAADASEGPMM